jgi:hypothetical protein
MRQLLDSLKFSLGMLILFVNLCATTPVFASSQTASEQTLIAAFLYNFFKFTEWPENSIENEITLCADKNSAFEELNAISGKLVQNKPVQVKFISLSDSYKQCQLLYLSRDISADNIREWIHLTKGQPTLVVSNASGFLDMGGMIALINDGKNLNFSVNLEVTRNSSLKLNAQLLQIAREVRGR